MGEIFSKVTVPRKDLYTTLINQMIAAGWRKLNEDHATGAYCDVMRAPGNSSGGGKQIWMLAPFDGIDLFNNATYDCRKTTSSNAIICYCSNYNSTSGLGVPIKNVVLGVNSWEYFSFLRNTNRRGYTTGTTYAKSTPMDADVDLYFNIGPEHVSFATIPQSTTLAKNEGCYTFFGKPEDCYFEEMTGTPANVVHGSTGHAQVVGANLPMFYFRPRNFKPDNSTKYTGTCYFVNPGSAPNIDGVYTLSDMYMGRVDEGIRFRIGNGFMFAGPSSELTCGDLIDVTVDGVTKLYVYINHLQPGSNEQGIPTTSFGLRIQ